MKQKYLNYYQKYSGIAPTVFSLDAIFTRSTAKRMSLKNRLKDYVGLGDKKDLFKLHGNLNKILFDSRDWPSYDYGEGYFYQSCELIGISGLRDTESRVKDMDLDNVVRDKTVLDIGCNSGFLSLSIANSAKKIIGLDINPNLINIGNTAKRYLGYENIKFLTSSFEDFYLAEPVDIVFSFANHSTYDKETKQSVEEYFTKCHNSLKTGGLLLFESHYPGYESKEKLERTLNIINKLFHVKESKILSKGTLLDQGRTFVLAIRKE